LTPQVPRSRAEGEPPRPGDVAAAIEACDLTRRFGSHTAVDQLTLSVPNLSTFGLLGANGAGKTTFIRMVAGFLLPSEGSVRVDGFSPAAQPSAVQARLGFVMETSRLYPELRVRGFLRFMAGARGLRGDARDRAVDRALERFELRDVASRLVGHLSKGFQQRVSLAQALLHDPPLVVVDEPTEGLDPVQQEEVQALLGTFHGERTVLVCTHDLREARLLCSRIAVLNAGRLVAEGPTDAVLGRVDTLALFRVRGDPP
jgi:ABC-2 type transport system ATP-binding protein